MGAILDPGSSTVPVEEESDLPPLGLAPALVVVSIPTFLLLVAFAIADGEWGLLAFGLVLLVLPLGVLFQRMLDRSEAKRRNTARRNRGPVDRVRSALDLSPTDGQDLTIRRLGGGGTHIVETYGGQETYVIVVAKNGLGVSKTFGSYALGKAWAQDFVQDPYAMDLDKEITYDEIARLQIEGNDLIISDGSWFHELRLPGWLQERAHQSQVRRLIDRLEFVEDPRSPGTYAALRQQEAKANK